MQRDLIIPREYAAPSAPPGSAPTLRLRAVRHLLRCRTGELYLGASTSRGMLSFFCCFDAGAYEDALVREWMAEVRDAALFFLAGAAGPSEGASQVKL